jgi:hypothetical protein
MSKLCIGVILVFLVLSTTAFAAGDLNTGSAGLSGQGTEIDSLSGRDSGEVLQASQEIETRNQGENSQIMVQEQAHTEADGTGNQTRVQTQQVTSARQGSFVNANGEQMQLKNENGITLRVRDVETHSALDIFAEQVQNRTQLRTTLSNGRNAEIWVMPTTASETAIQRLQLNYCRPDNNCSIELKEIGQGEQARAAYEIMAQKQTKVLGLFQARMQVQAQVDAESGEVIQAKKPWWAFLATE